VGSLLRTQILSLVLGLELGLVEDFVRIRTTLTSLFLSLTKKRYLPLPSPYKNPFSSPPSQLFFTSNPFLPLFLFILSLNYKLKTFHLLTTFIQTKHTHKWLLITKTTLPLSEKSSLKIEESWFVH
jgi:hypothetical protein